MAYEMMGEFESAVADYTAALKLDIQKQREEYYNNRGIVFFRMGKINEALSDLNNAISINPDYIDAYYNRAIILQNIKRYFDAIQDYKTVLDRSPKHLMALNSLGWLLATCPDDNIRNGAQALVYAKRAFEIDNASFVMDTMAAAYAEISDFEKAVKYQEMAIRKLKSEKSAQINSSLQKMNERLKLYTKNESWRDE